MGWRGIFLENDSSYFIIIFGWNLFFSWMKSCFSYQRLVLTFVTDSKHHRYFSSFLFIIMNLNSNWIHAYHMFLVRYIAATVAWPFATTRAARNLAKKTSKSVSMPYQKPMMYCPILKGVPFLISLEKKDWRIRHHYQVVGVNRTNTMAILTKRFCNFSAPITHSVVRFSLFAIPDNLLFCTEFQEEMNSQMKNNFGGPNGRGQPRQDPPIERELFLTLEEIYMGCLKKMKVSRRVCAATECIEAC